MATEYAFVSFGEGEFRLTKIDRFEGMAELRVIAETPFGAFHAAMTELALTDDEMRYYEALARQQAERGE